jgi:50S ribosomal subunit-associated GTPase HflX
MDKKPLATIVLVNKEDTVSDEELTEFLSRDFVKIQIPKTMFISMKCQNKCCNLTKKRLEDFLPKENLPKQNSWGLE